MSNLTSYPIFTHLQSEKHAHAFLKKVYERQGLCDVDILSYQNASSFMYAISSGMAFLNEGKQASLLTQPMLLFYGCAHLIKGLLLAVHPAYPSTTKELAHGVSSRKIKKKNYSFLQDDIRTQRHGLFPVAATSIFKQTIQPHQTYSMHQLLALIPEMDSLFSLQGQSYLEHIGCLHTQQITFSEQLLRSYHLTIEGILQKIKAHVPAIHHQETHKDGYTIHFKDFLAYSNHPFFMEQATGKLFFPNRRSFFIQLDELLIHYLVLYNISMITRYEHEWWGETIGGKIMTDFPMIQHFLAITVDKVPFLTHMYIESLI